VLSNRLRIGLLLAALAAPAAAFASEPPRRADPGEQRSPQAEARAQRDPAPELICRSIEIAGSDAAPMVCMTASDWRRVEQ